MTFDVIINKKAIADIQKTTKYYNKQRDGLGGDFKSAIDEFIGVLEINPNFKIRYDKIRCLPVKTFPYMIHFSIFENKKLVKVHAVLHTSRNPKLWKNMK